MSKRARSSLAEDRIRWNRRSASVIRALLLLSAFQQAAIAHPMGNFAICHYARIEANADGLRGRTVLDFAEIPTVTEKQAIDLNGDGVCDRAEIARYLHDSVPRLASGLRLSIAGRSARLVPESPSIRFQAGAAGLQTMKISFTWRVLLPRGHGCSVVYSDGNFPDRTGWKEIVVTARQGMRIESTTASLQDQSGGLEHYPADVVPPQSTTATVSFVPGTPAVTAPVSTPAHLRTATPRDAFTEAIARRTLTPGLMALGLAIAFLFGAFHALSPGHGKTMVGAYLVGSRGTASHAVLLGLLVTATHTFGVFALGFATLFASRYVVPERLYPILGILSGTAIFGVGVALLTSRLRALRRATRNTSPLANPRSDGGHDHAHHHDGHHHRRDPEDHNHLRHHHGHHSHDHHQQADHSRDHDHHHDGGHPHGPGVHPEHTHDHDGHTHHGHDHHDHDHHDHDHHDHDHHDHDHHDHDHHGHHHHLPEGPITARALVALGVSGGIVPCPSALVVLLSAIALHRVGYGLVLIAMFSLGLASVLMAIGLLVVSAGEWLNRLPIAGRWIGRLPVVSAGLVTLVGLGLVARTILTGLP